MAYDNIHRRSCASMRPRHSCIPAHHITHKTQEHLRYTGEKARPQRGTTYDWAYAYTGPQPHAPTLIGERAFHYDANGNQTGWDHTQNGTRRSIEWDDENRIQAIKDPGNTLRFKYDDQGMRTQKRGQHGETVYVNQAALALPCASRHSCIHAHRATRSETGPSLPSTSSPVPAASPPG